jgi:hypothetical protein
MDAMQRARFDAAAVANAEDASVWRWFSALLEERRIRWRYTFDNWVISVDRMRVATEPTFDGAIRAAKDEAELRKVGQPGECSRPKRRRAESSEYLRQQP